MTDAPLPASPPPAPGSPPRRDSDLVPSGSARGPAGAQAYWGGVLDPQNLEREAGAAGAAGLALEDEIAFAQTPDFEAARAWLASGAAAEVRGGAGRGAAVVDLGAGLGANSFAWARSGRTVWAVDTSLRRLRALRQRAAEAGCGGEVRCIVAAAEALPFADRSIRSLYTKSVLIHTDLARAAAALARVLAPGGRAALVEPQPGNPFAWAYRRLWGPAAWRTITRYFDPAAQQIFLDALPPGGRGDACLQPFYLFSFLAFVFQFGWPRRRIFRPVLGWMMPLDRGLFRVFPRLRRLAWFGVLTLEKEPLEPAVKGGDSFNETAP